MTVLAVVPARGGSKGVPRKNLCLVGGRSLVRRAIDVLLESAICTEIVVSTEDAEIAGEARSTGVEVDIRPVTLASDTATTEAVLTDLLVRRAKRGHTIPNILVLAEPPHPFRRSATVRAAVEAFQHGSVRSVVSICSLQHKPQFIFRREYVLRRYIDYPNEFFATRQDMRHLCRLSGSIWVVGTSDFLREGRLLLDPIGWVESDPLEAINIDTQLDLDFARYLAYRDRR